MLWIFFPRNLGRIVLKDKSITGISLTYAVSDSPGESVTLSQGQKYALLAAFDGAYVRPKIIGKREASENLVGCMIFMTGSDGGE